MALKEREKSKKKDISAILMMCLRDAKQYGNHYNWRIIYPHEDGNSDHIQIIRKVKKLYLIHNKSNGTWW